MDLRRKKPVDMSGVKRSRASHTGAVTRIWDKLKAMACDQPEEVQLLKTSDIKTYLKTLNKTEAGFNSSLDEAQEFAPEDEAEDTAFQQEEEDAADAFFESISAAKGLAEQLLAYKATLTGIKDFKTDLEALQQSLESEPDQDNSISLSSIQSSFTSLRQQWEEADLNPDHPIKAELDACRRSLTIMERDVSAAKTRSLPTPATSSSSRTPFHSSHHYIELPKIKVPTFNGDLMGWSTF